MGIVLFSGAIIVSLFAMQARMPQWLLMFCSGWTLFTLLNVTWQPLMVFQLALIWGGYAFLAPKGLPQRKPWELIGRKAMRSARAIYPEKSATMTYDQPQINLAKSNGASNQEYRKSPRTNKSVTIPVFLLIFIISCIIHLMPFNYSQALAQDQIARATGGMIIIFIVSRLGLLFYPNKTFGVIIVAVIFSPFAILLDRANDPIAPTYFHDLIYPRLSRQDEVMKSGALQANENLEQSPVTPLESIENPSGKGMPVPSSLEPKPIIDSTSSDQRLVNKMLASDPIFNPGIFDIPVEEGDFITAKMNQVTEASVRKQREAAARMPETARPNGYALATMVATGKGLSSASQRDRDFVTMTPNEFRGRYGDEVADSYLAAYSEGDVTRRTAN